MGFITTGTTTISVSAYLTQRGRELLLTNKNDFQVVYFALGDSDCNYNIANKLITGFVPDITGDSSDCIKSIAPNVEIKNKITKI